MQYLIFNGHIWLTILLERLSLNSYYFPFIQPNLFFSNRASGTLSKNRIGWHKSLSRLIKPICVCLFWLMWTMSTANWTSTGIWKLRNWLAIPIISFDLLRKISLVTGMVEPRVISGAHWLLATQSYRTLWVIHNFYILYTVKEHVRNQSDSI